MTFRIASATACLVLLTAAALPQTAPAPEPRPDVAGAPPPKPVPVPRPDDTSEPAVPTARPDEEPQGPPVPPPPPIASESDEDHQACEAQLRKIGAAFRDVPRIDDGKGCGIDKPIQLSEALPGITLKPQGTMRCETALALAHWMKETVIPAGEAALEKAGPIKTINQASTYICRLRNNAATGKISEHARGNAVDVASFTFENGTVVAVEPRREDPTFAGAFQRAVSAAGCLYFTTVLDPESDANHEHHFHLDVMKRNGGYRYCH